jgi:hypothetical protein
MSLIGALASITAWIDGTIRSDGLFDTPVKEDGFPVRQSSDRGNDAGCDLDPNMVKGFANGGAGGDRYYPGQWRGEMKKIETYTYETPTADNKDCPFSVGVLNLTREEARSVAGFASQLIAARGGDLSAYTRGDVNTDSDAVKRYDGTVAKPFANGGLVVRGNPDNWGSGGGTKCAKCKQPINGAMVLVQNFEGSLAYHTGCNPGGTWRPTPVKTVKTEEKEKPPGNRFSGLDLK